MLFLARVLEPTKFGELSLLITLASIFTSFQDMGTSPIVVRQIASKKLDPAKTLVAVLVIKLLSATIFFVSFIFLVDILGYSNFAGSFAYLFALGFISESLLLSVIKYFEGKEEMQFSSILIIAERLIIATLLILISLSIGLFNGYGISYLISNSTVLIIILCFTIKKNGFLKNIDIWIVKELLMLSFPFFIYNFFSILYFRLDIFIISKYFQEAFVGTYRASFQLVDSLYFISLSLTISLLPFFSRKYKEDNKHLEKSFLFILKELFFIGIILATVLYINSEQILRILYKGKYLNGAVTLGILSVTLPFFFSSNIIGTFLISIGKEKIQILSMIISTLLKTLLLVILVQLYGILGAAISCIVAEFISFCIQYYGVRISGYKFQKNRTDITYIYLIVTVIVSGILLKNLFLHTSVVILLFIYHYRNNLKLIITTLNSK